MYKIFLVAPKQIVSYVLDQISEFCGFRLKIRVLFNVLPYLYCEL